MHKSLAITYFMHAKCGNMTKQEATAQWDELLNSDATIRDQHGPDGQVRLMIDTASKQTQGTGQKRDNECAIKTEIGDAEAWLELLLLEKYGVDLLNIYCSTTSVATS